MQAIVRRLPHCFDVVYVGDGLDVRQDAGADHQRKKVYGDHKSRTDAEAYEEPVRDVLLLVQLDLYHRHLQYI